MIVQIKEEILKGIQITKRNTKLGTIIGRKPTYN